MNKETFAMIENYMISCMNDSAHNKEHIYRVLYNALRIARTLIYKGTVSEPLYSLLENRMVSNGENDENPSFFQEYKYKLEKIYSNFYTEEGMKMALERQKSAIDFYDSLFGEVRTTYEAGQEELEELLKI